ncbi:MAG: glutamine synthetase, partial [Pseudomonadota bacterium]
MLPEGTTALRLAVADLNGQARGKRLPASAAGKVLAAGARMPLSVLNVDVAGNDIAASPLVFATGDADGVLRATGRGPLPAPWLDTPTAVLPMWMFAEDGAPFGGDPRQALAQVVERYTAKGWAPIVATELEFYLI